MSSICAFCCTHIDSTTEEKATCSKEKILKTFSKVTQSHFGVNVTLIGDGQEGGCDYYDNVCLKCEQSLKSICELYRDLECIRLKMEWQLRELIKKMEIVGRTPSKIKWLRRNQQANDFQRMSNFRNDFISKCNRLLIKSMPTITLDRSQHQFKEIPKESIKIEQDSEYNFNDYEDTTTMLTLPAKEDIDDETEDGNRNGKQKKQRGTIRKPFKCVHCPAKYSQRNNLLRHQRSHHSQHLELEPQSILKCAHVNCSASFLTLFLMRRHNRECHDNAKDNISETTCPICDKTCSDFRHLMIHMRNRHDSESSRLPFACDVPKCPKRFPSEATLKWHRMFYYHVKWPRPSVIKDSDNKNGSEPSKLPVKKYISCPHCPVKFSFRSNFIRHLKKRHLQPNQPNCIQFQEIPKPTVKIEKDNNELYKPIGSPSNVNFDNIEEDTTTILTFSKETADPDNKPVGDQTKQPSNSLRKKLQIKKPFSCPRCPAKYSQQNNLLRHQRTLNHHLKDLEPGSILKCAHTNCSASFSTLFQLRRHKRERHNDNDNISETTCPICGRICSHIANLKVHMKTLHDDENPELPFTCDVPQCPKRFPTESVLKWHRMFYYHGKKRPLEIFNCSKCHKNFHGPGAFKKHLKFHQRPEAPWVCELCGVAFKSKSILRHHGLFHKGPDNWAFQCEECGKKCATKHYLKEHMHVHSDVKRYSCQCCGRGFKCRQKLRNHVNKFHAKEGFQDIPRKTTKPKLISRRVPTSTQPD